MAFSRELGLSAQNFSLIIRGINCPNSESTLQIQEILETQIMKTDVDPPQAAPRLSNRDPNQPKTLQAALERIDQLNGQLQSRPGAAIASSPTKPKLADANSEPVYSTDLSFAPDKDSPKMPVNYPTPAKKALPPDADTPVLIQKILDVTNLHDLRSLLDNNVHSKLQRTCIYAEVCKRRELLGDG